MAGEKHIMTPEETARYMRKSLSWVYKNSAILGGRKEQWKEVYKDISKDHCGLVGTVINRGEAQVLRLSMIYALLDGRAIIELRHLNSAIKFWKFCEDSAKIIFSEREETSFQGIILNSLLDKPKSKTEIYRIFKNKVRKEKINETLNELIATKKIQFSEVKTNRKAKMVYRISL